PDTPFAALNLVSWIDVQPGEYYAEAWLRAPPDGATGVGTTGIQLFFHPADGGPVTIEQGSQIVPSATWRPSSASFTLPQRGQLELTVHSYEPGGGCVLIDDVGLYRQ